MAVVVEDGSLAADPLPGRARHSRVENRRGGVKFQSVGVVLFSELV